MAQSSYEQLLDRLARKDERIAQLETHIARLEAQIRELSAQLHDALRAAKRPSAPFSKGPPKDHPKPPGRKSGAHYGPKAHRPVPEAKPDEVIDVPRPETCPDCGGPVVEESTAQQFQTEIPRRPILRRFDLHIGRCTRCGKRVQPRHPLQTSDALGAAASQLGADAQTAIVHLNKQAGLSHGRIAGFFQTLFGIGVSRSGGCQATLRAARRCEPIHAEILARAPEAPWVVPDETGWRVGGRRAWMHGLVTPWATIFQIAQGRGRDVLETLLGADYDGTMTHDGWAPYDGFALAWHQQCLNHLLHRCKDLLAVARAGAVRFPRQVRDLLTDALRLRDRRDAGDVSPHGLAVATGRLEGRLDRLLRWFRSNPDNERFAKHLANHRDQVFTFLRQPGIDATNYRAEQAMRLAAVLRKTWGGNRTWVGARAQAVLMTVLATASQHVADAFGFLADVLRGPAVHLPLLPSGP